MKTVFIFRHGETTWNLKNMIQGHSDIPLNSRGLEQAQTIVPRLRDATIEKIYSSDLIRAMQTTEIVNEHLQVPIEFRRNLREGNLGTAEGQTLDWVKNNFEALFWDLSGCTGPNYWEFAYPKGESRHDVVSRFSESIENISEQVSVVSTHGGVLRLYLLHLIQKHSLQMMDLPIPNCALYCIQFAEVPTISQLN